MNEELRNENQIENLEQRLLDLPSVDPSTTIVTLPEEEERGSIVPVVIGIGTVVAAGVAAGAVWMKNRRDKANRIQELEAELAFVTAQLEGLMKKRGDKANRIQEEEGSEE